jgi:hypothetical protein
MATTLTVAVSGDSRWYVQPRASAAAARRPPRRILASPGSSPDAAARSGRCTSPGRCRTATRARSTKAVFLAQLLPFALGFLVAGGAALVAAWYGATVFGLDEVGQPNPRTPNSWVLAGAAGQFGGIKSGFVVELVAPVVLMPVFGRALLAAPLLVPSLFTDADDVAGLQGKAQRRRHAGDAALRARRRGRRGRRGQHLPSRLSPGRLPRSRVAAAGAGWAAGCTLRHPRPPFAGRRARIREGSSLALVLLY